MQLKKLPVIFALAFAMLFLSCFLNIERQSFELDEETTISMGEKLYLDSLLWIRFDSVSEDTRCPITVVCDNPGWAVLHFTVCGIDASGANDQSQTLVFRTDTLNSQTFTMQYTGMVGGREYLMVITGVRPYRSSFDDVIRQSEYQVSFILEWTGSLRKPNIYLYPEKKRKLSVSLDFPQGGEVVKSIPCYPDKWQKIKVEPTGLIEKKYGYLFYEADVPDLWQYKQGWSVKTEELEPFFRKNLTAYGFNQSEIADFINYWIPRLKKSSWYNIYPQTTAMINKMVTLNISKEPRSLLRLFYVIKESETATDISAPAIPRFVRNGFTVTEWGVIIR